MSAWTTVTTSELRQGDVFPACEVPVLSASYGEGAATIPLVKYDIIVVTHSCDLVVVNDGLPVSVCQIGTVDEFEQTNPHMREGGRWGQARKGYLEGLHLLPSVDSPQDGRASFVVDFRRVFSLPHGYLRKRAEDSTERLRLVSPYLEHFSQAFARYFMRVGLPQQIPNFK